MLRTPGHQADMDSIRDQAAEMAYQVREMLVRATEAYARRDPDLARATIDEDEAVNALEVKTDASCLRVLARRQPLASDLRALAATLKVVTDLERVGDLAVNVCERTIELSRLVGAGLPPGMDRLVGAAVAILDAALRAMNERSAELAEAVIEQDRALDEAFVGVFAGLEATMQRNAHLVPAAIRHQAVAKCLERVGDHATNVAELVLFELRGDDVRHSGPSALVSHPPPRA